MATKPTTRRRSSRPAATTSRATTEETVIATVMRGWLAAAGLELPWSIGLPPFLTGGQSKRPSEDQLFLKSLAVHRYRLCDQGRQLLLRYLVLPWSATPARADEIATHLVFAALGREDLLIDPDAALPSPLAERLPIDCPVPLQVDVPVMAPRQQPPAPVAHAGLELRFGKPDALRGQVIDAGGTPLSFVHVTCQGFPGTRANRHGAFTIRGVPADPSRQYEIAIRHHRFPVQWSPDPITLRLP